MKNANDLYLLGRAATPFPKKYSVWNVLTRLATLFVWAFLAFTIIYFTAFAWEARNQQRRLLAADRQYLSIIYQAFEKEKARNPKRLRWNTGRPYRFQQKIEKVKGIRAI